MRLADSSRKGGPLLSNCTEKVSSLGFLNGSHSCTKDHYITKSHYIAKDQ